MGFIFPNFRGENDKRYLSCHHHDGLILEKKSHPMVIKDFGVFRQEWVMESWANMIIASPLIVWVCVVASFYRAVTGLPFHRLLLDFHIS